MALVLHDRVQEITTTTGTGSVTLDGAVTGYQSFAVIGNGNTTFYCIAGQGTDEWEVGLGTYSSTGPALARTTVLSSSNSGSLVNFSTGSKAVFVTYPSEKSVNLDASGNVSALGTITSGVWNGTTIPVAYGGTGVTSSSGANSVVLRDTNQNIVANKISQTVNNITASGGTTTLTVASAFWQTLTGTGSEIITLPDATTLPVGYWYIFDNDATGTLTVKDYATTTLDVIPAGGYSLFYLDANGTVAGSWNRAGLIPSEVNWGTNSLDLGGSTVITNGHWHGSTIETQYGGTGLTGFGSANYALYSSNATALTAGTLPIAAGGTGQTTASAAFNALSPITTTGDLIVGNGSNSATRLAIGSSNQVLTSNGTTAVWETLSGGTDIVTTDFTATAGQTTFTVSYVVGLVEVFRNGVKLAQADFTANNGTTVVLATAANSGDIVEVVSYQPINVYANITTDTFSGDGTDTTFTMSVTPYDAASLLVVISGVVQAPDTYSVSGTTLTFSAAPPSGTDNISVRYLGVASTGAVTTFSGGTTGLTPSSATGGAVTLGGTLAIANGGTGANSATAAFNALAPSQTGNSGKYLTTDGTNTSWDQINISTADITGTLAIANGGTGATTASTALANLGGVTTGKAIAMAIVFGG